MLIRNFTTQHTQNVFSLGIHTSLTKGEQIFHSAAGFFVWLNPVHQSKQREQHGFCKALCWKNIIIPLSVLCSSRTKETMNLPCVSLCLCTCVRSRPHPQDCLMSWTRREIVFDSLRGAAQSGCRSQTRRVVQHKLFQAHHSDSALDYRRSLSVSFETQAGEQAAASSDVSQTQVAR